MLEEKYQRLRDLLAAYEKAIVAYSGGVDSAFLLKVAVDVLGTSVLAVTADSPSLPRAELRAAEDLARSMGAEHLVIPTGEMEDPHYTSNPPNRCYFCKTELYTHLARVGSERGIFTILNGINRDDNGDFRPGMQAAREWRVISPLLEVGLGKTEIRDLAKRLGLPVWNKPAMACLSSRIPYGETVTPEKLRMIEEAESFLRTLGLEQIRVRLHPGKLARIEVAPDQLEWLTQPEVRASVVAAFKEFGYLHVTLDLQGYRMGSMNEALRQPVFLERE